MLVNKITDLIGNTPLIKLDQSKHKLKINIFSKLEYLNPFGSLKDRMAWEMIKDDIETIKNKNLTIIENSSGNTAKALAILAKIIGVNFKIITNRIKFSEKKDVLKIVNTIIEELPGKSQCLDPNDPYDPQFFLEKEINKNPNKYFFTNQYFNVKNKNAHIKTGEEIIKDLQGKIDYFVSGVGTAGSTLGIKEAFEKHKLNVKIIGVIAKGTDTIPGIRNQKELFSVGLFDKKNYDQLIEIDPYDAALASIELIKDYGIISGPTGGSSYAAIKKLFAKEKKPLNVVFLACDRYEFYLSYYKKMFPEIFDIKKNNQNINNVNTDIFDKSVIIDINDLKKLKNYLIIDIRINLSYQIEHLPNSINIPESYLEDMINGPIFSKDKNIIFVCPNGERSIKYAIYFRNLGYKSFSLKDGILGLRKIGYKLERLI